jgi:hypothetical protein
MMKAYVSTEKHGVRAWTADVVSEQDYHQRGPHARSHRTEPHALPTTARKAAEDWADRNGYRIVPVECI